MRTIQFHWAINAQRCGPQHRRRIRNAGPYGVLGEQYGITVSRLLPDHPYAVASQCRIERNSWHNRVHHATVRYIGTAGGRTLEYGELACGGSLINPLYTDTPVRLCDCGNGEATMCPRCELAFHGLALAGACDDYRARLRVA